MYEWAHFLNVLPAVWGFFNDPSPTGIFCHPCSHRFCRTHPVHRDMELELHWCAGSLLYFPAPWWFCSLENKFSQSQELCWQYLGSSASAWFSSDGCRAVMKFGINVKHVNSLVESYLLSMITPLFFFFSFSFLFKSRQASRESKTIETKVYGNLQVCFLMTHNNLYVFPKLYLSTLKYLRMLLQKLLCNKSLQPLKHLGPWKILHLSFQ